MNRFNNIYSKNIRLIPAVLFLFFSINCSTMAQPVAENSQRTISININAEEKTPEAAFDTHKKREAVLASLLKEFDIKEESINFEPIRINKRTNYNNRQEEVTVNTNQQVSVSFSDFEIYEKIQVSLIENGFDSFNGSFSSSELEEGKDKALVSAIQQAKEKATFIAQQSGVTLGNIQTINYSEHQVNYPPMAMEADVGRFKSESASMMDFAQTVSVTSTISINFEIVE